MQCRFPSRKAAFARASLRLGATAMKMLRVPAGDIELIVQGVRDWDYQPVLEDEDTP